MLHLQIINGPNLNLLGTREPHFYGSLSFEVYLKTLEDTYPSIQFIYFQSNIEGELVTALQQAALNGVDGIVLNAAAYTHTSIALADAAAAITTPVVEVHISNVYKREVFRHNSYIAPHCVGSISGFGLHGYDLAINALIHQLKQK